MANFFSADYWKALYFRAMGGQETAVDPNAMRGTFAGTSAFSGALDQPAGALSGTFAGVAAFTASATFVEDGLVQVVVPGRRRREREEWANLSRALWLARVAADRAQQTEREDLERAEQDRAAMEAALEQAAAVAAEAYEKTIAKRAALVRLLDLTERARLAEELRRQRAERAALNEAQAYLQQQIREAENKRRAELAQQAAMQAELERLDLQRRQDDEAIILLLLAA